MPRNSSSRQSSPCRAVGVADIAKVFVLMLIWFDCVKIHAKKVVFTPHHAPHCSRSLTGVAVLLGRGGGPQAENKNHTYQHWRLRGGEGDDKTSPETAVADKDGDTTTEEDASKGQIEVDNGSGVHPQDYSAGKATVTSASNQGSCSTSSNTTECEVDAGEVFGMKKGVLGKTGGSTAMQLLRRVCYYLVDVLIIEAQRLRFVGHLLAAAGVIREDKVPPRFKQRRGRWWRTVELSSGDECKVQTKSHPSKRDEKEPSGADDGAGLAHFLRSGVVGMLGGDKHPEIQLLNKDALKHIADAEEVTEDDEGEGRPRVLQQWPPPPEHFLLAGDCVRLIPPNKRPGALCIGVRPYIDPYTADDETPDMMFERLALQERNASVQGRRAADPNLAVEALFSPLSLQHSQQQIALLNSSTQASLQRLRTLQAAVRDLKERVLTKGLIESSQAFEQAWSLLEAQAAEYNTEEQRAHELLARAIQGMPLDPFEQFPQDAHAQKVEQPPLDYEFGKMSIQQVDHFMTSHGFQKISREEGAGEGEEEVAVARLQYRLPGWHGDQDKDWSPYMPPHFVSAAAREYWSGVQGVTCPKDLAEIAAELLGSPFCFPELWPAERKQRDLEPFWQAYCNAVAAGFVASKDMTYDIQSLLSRNVKDYPSPPDPALAATAATAATASSYLTAPPTVVSSDTATSNTSAYSISGGTAASASSPPPPERDPPPERCKSARAEYVRQHFDTSCHFGAATRCCGGRISGITQQLPPSYAPEIPPPSYQCEEAELLKVPEKVPEKVRAHTAADTAATATRLLTQLTPQADQARDAAAIDESDESAAELEEGVISSSEAEAYMSVSSAPLPQSAEEIEQDKRHTGLMEEEEEVVLVEEEVEEAAAAAEEVAGVLDGMEDETREKGPGKEGEEAEEALAETEDEHQEAECETVRAKDEEANETDKHTGGVAEELVRVEEGREAQRLRQESEDDERLRLEELARVRKEEEAQRLLGELEAVWQHSWTQDEQSYLALCQGKGAGGKVGSGSGAGRCKVLSNAVKQRSRFLQTRELVALEYKARAGGGGLPLFYVALAQALVCESVDVDARSGLTGWKRLWARIASSEEPMSSFKNCSKSPALAGEEDDIEGRRRNKTEALLGMLAEAVRERMAGRARQLVELGASLDCLSLAANAFHVSISLLKVGAEGFEECVFSPSQESVSSLSHHPAQPERGGEEREAGRHIYLCSTGSRIWALKRSDFPTRMAGVDRAFYEAVGASDEGRAGNVYGNSKRAEKVSKLVNKVQERVVRRVCNASVELGVRLIGLQLD